MIRFTIGIKTPNPTNGSQGRTRSAVMAKAALRKKQRNAAKLATLAALRRSGSLTVGTLAAAVNAGGILVTLTRLSAGTLDSDGCQAALKSVRDGVADALGVNDGSRGIGWEYKQYKCPRFQYGVTVEIA